MVASAPASSSTGATERTEDRARVPYAAPPQGATRARREQMKNRRVERAISQMAGCQAQVQPKRIERQAQAFDPKLCRVLHQNVKHSRVKVQMQMAVNMVKRQPEGAELLELGVDFGAQLVA